MLKELFYLGIYKKWCKNVLKNKEIYTDLKNIYCYTITLGITINAAALNNAVLWNLHPGFSGETHTCWGKSIKTLISPGLFEFSSYPVI